MSSSLFHCRPGLDQIEVNRLVERALVYSRDGQNGNEQRGAISGV